MTFENKIDCTTNLSNWFEKFDIANTVVRYWIHDKFEDEFATCMFGYFRQLIDLGAGKWLVGIESTEENDEPRVLEFYPLDLITFQIISADQDDKGDK